MPITHCSQHGNKLFPAWEHFIPNVGKNIIPCAGRGQQMQKDREM